VYVSAYNRFIIVVLTSTLLKYGLERISS